MFGYTSEYITGKNIDILIPENERAMHDNHLQHYKKGDKETDIVGKGREIMALHKKGSVFPVEISLSEIFIENKRMFTGIIRDVSERYYHEEQIRRTQKMDALGKLTGGIAHDYNNMLAIILGYSEILKTELSKDKRLTGFVKEIFKAGERGSKLTNKLLDFSRHKPAKEKNIVNINSLILDLERMLKSTLTARIDLNFNLESNLWNANIDIADFENAILNMCINAMHAIDESGKIIITTENILIDERLSSLLNVKPGDYVKLCVADTGSGITKEIQEHIFDPFYSTKNDKGTGLGLSQVYGFIQRSNGAVKVYSEEGYGANFNLYLPRCSDNDDEVSQLDTPVSSSDSYKGNEKILIVDDEPALVMLAEEILSDLGYELFTAISGADALSILKEQPDINLLLSDIIMPEMDGYELASIVKEQFPDVLIQFASGYASIEERQKTSYQYLDIITKPYSASKLAKKIRKLLD